MTSALENYLDYYKTCTSPGYAVLVTGEWGIGKTYQVKQALKDNIYYVSLFGLKTAEEVHSEIYIAMHPKFSLLANIAKSTEKTAKDAGGVYAIAGMVPGLVNAALRKQVETDKVLVFDDLERCLLETKSIQGIINRYVDECGCRLVIIAHDEKLTDKEGKLERIFIEGKEKIIGQTIRVEPQTEEAFSKFCEGLKKTDRNFIKGYKSEIIRIFKASGKKSLRILKHVMEDLARFYNCLDKKHIAHREAMAELVNLFLALDFEIRNNKLSESDVKDRQKSMMGYYIRYTSNKKKHALVNSKEKYPDIDLDNDSLLQDNVWIKMFFHGLYDKTTIQKSLNASYYFAKPEQIQPWKTVWNCGRLEDDVVLPAKQKMDRQFKNREVTNSGEMLHIFALRMMMAEEGIIDSTVSDEVAAAKKYIDGLLKQEILPPRELEWNWRDGWEMSHDGCCYWKYERKEFKDVLKYLISAREEALVNRFPGITPDILKMMETDVQSFLNNICHTQNGPNAYAVIPILCHIPAKKFVKTWLGSPVKNWILISRAFQARYEGVSLNGDLQCEKPWVKEVLYLLKKEAKDAEGFRALRIRKTIPDKISKLLTKEDE